MTYSIRPLILLRTTMQVSPRLLLYPFSLIYCLITGIRNFLFDKNIFKSTNYTIPLISVGNLTVGGTGKTPLTEYLIKLLFTQYNCALLSRGYGRKTKGPLIADASATPEKIGDEPMQMKNKFSGLTVAVAEKRIAGMHQLLSLSTPPDVVLLDDAFQHRSVKPGFSILVTDFARPIYEDLCLPAGNLREPVSGKKRAQIILVNKCPANLSDKKRRVIENKLKVGETQQVFFSTVSYQSPRNLTHTNHLLPKSKDDHPYPILALAGIANPKPFFNELKKYSNRITTLTFPDHHDFSISDLSKIERKLDETGNNAFILTTEKDAVRLKHKKISQALADRIWYIPIEIKIMFNQQQAFNKSIEQYVKKNQGDR